MWSDQNYSRGENAAVIAATALLCCREHKAALYWGRDGTIFSPLLPSQSRSGELTTTGGSGNDRADSKVQTRCTLISISLAGGVLGRGGALHVLHVAEVMPEELSPQLLKNPLAGSPLR